MNEGRLDCLSVQGESVQGEPVKETIDPLEVTDGAHEPPRDQQTIVRLPVRDPTPLSVHDAMRAQGFIHIPAPTQAESARIRDLLCSSNVNLAPLGDRSREGEPDTTNVRPKQAAPHGEAKAIGPRTRRANVIPQTAP